MNLDYKSLLKYTGILIVIVFIQKTFIYYIALSDFNIIPDLVVIAIAYIGAKEGKIHGMLFGFFTGLLVDILSGSFFGLSALSYSLAAFIAGFFKTENDKFIYKWYFMVTVFSSSLVANIIYFGFYFQGTPLNFTFVLLSYVMTSSTYTTLMSFIYTIIPRRKEIDRSFISES